MIASIVLVIPRYHVDIDPTLPSAASYWTPSAEELQENGSPGGFHNTYLIQTDLDEARAVIEAEVEAIEYISSRSATASDFDELALDIEFEMPDVPSDEAPDFFEHVTWYGLNGLEVGVAGLVYALNAVGIVTAASCRSHHESHRSWSAYPVVVFAASRDQLDELQPLVAKSGCGFELDEVDRPHLLAIVAPSISNTMWLFAIEGVVRSSASVRGWVSRSSMMEVPRLPIRKTSTCSTLHSRPLI